MSRSIGCFVSSFLLLVKTWNFQAATVDTTLICVINIGRISNHLLWFIDIPGRTTREKRRVRTARNLECPEYPDRDFFCLNDGVGGEDLRGDTGPQGNLGPRGSSKMPQSIVLN